MKDQITKMAVRTGLQLKKYSPEILMVAGVAGIVGGTVMACRATLKLEAFMDEKAMMLESIEAAGEKGEHARTVGNEQDQFYGYETEDYKHDTTIVKVQTAVGIAKMYAPAATLLIFGIACVLGSHGIMRKRNIALLGAYKMAEEAFTQYRGRVVEELGEEKDRQFRYGGRLEEIEVTTTDAKGKEKKETKTVLTADMNGLSQYARIFDESCPEWQKAAEWNFTFLNAQQNYWNDRLQAHGHVFLNEVYDALGFPRTQAGQVVGWVKGNGDNFIDFGIFDRDRQQVRDFVNGYERNIVLDFNVDGVVYDLI